MCDDLASEPASELLYSPVATCGISDDRSDTHFVEPETDQSRACIERQAETTPFVSSKLDAKKSWPGRSVPSAKP